MYSRRARSEEGGRVESIRDFVQRTLQIGGSTRKSRIGREREIGNEELDVKDSFEEQIQGKNALDMNQENHVQEASNELVRIYRTLASGNQEEILLAHKKLNIIQEARIKREMDARSMEKSKRNNMSCVQLEPPSNLIPDPTVRANVMKNLNSLVNLKFQMGDSLALFVDNLNSYVDSVSSINSGEYNLLLFSLLNQGAKDRLAGMSSPAKMETAVFLRTLCFYLEVPKTRFDRLRELYAYKPSKNVQTIQEIISEICRLADNAFPSYDPKKDEIVYEALKSAVPVTVKAKLSLIYDEVSFRQGNKYPSLNDIIISITPDLAEINLAIKNEMKSSVFVRKIDAQQDMSKPQAFVTNTAISTKPPCGFCRLNGHETNKCFKNPLSTTYKGVHSCTLCRGNHKTPLCILYPNTIPVAESCSFCSNMVGLLFFHPEKACLIRKKMMD